MKRLDIGKMRHRATFERKVSDGSFDDAGSEAWEPVATVWAEVVDVLPSRGERAAENLNLASHPATVRIRYRTDIDSGMRITVGDRVMQIISGPAEMGNRDGLEIGAEDYSTAGGQ